MNLESVEYAIASFASALFQRSSMDSITQTDNPIFDGGPFPHFQKGLGLFRPAGLRTSSRATTVVVLGWGVLVVIALVESLATPGTLRSFLQDFAVHGRSLIAAPLFIIAESVSLPRLERVASHFCQAGIVTGQDRPEFERAIASTRRLINSGLAEVVAILLAYLFAVFMIRYVLISVFLPFWRLSHNSGYPPFSWAGWWQVLVSLPLLLILFFGWVWRAVLWGRFLVKVSRLDLQLIAAHPDGAAGLKFIENTLFAFMPVAFTLGIVAAASVANRVIIGEMSLSELQRPILGLTGFVCLLFVSPLMIFSLTLLWQKRLGVLSYGALAHLLGRQFERKWLDPNHAVSDEALEAPDFSATTDLYQIVSNVHQINGLPFDLSSLISLLVVTLLPFLPVALLSVPLDTILREVAKLLF